MQSSSSTRQRVIMIALGLGLTAVGAELGTRQMIGTDAPSIFSDPANYADPLCDEEYWVLQQQIREGDSPSEHPRLTRHPVLGWTTDPDHQNLLGAWKTPALRQEDAPRVAIFGDSFVHGTYSDGERLPDYLQSYLPEKQVLNYGVGGYGLGQIVLSMEHRLPQIQADEVVIGVMLTDLDRTVLRLRDARKPYFSWSGTTMVQHTTHLEGPPSTSPPSQSRLLGWLEHGLWRQLSASLGLPRPTCRVAEKTAITAALIDRAALACQTHGVRCRLLLFPHREAFGTAPGWRTKAIHSAAAGADLLVLDAGRLWAEQGFGMPQIYGSDRHPTAAANAVVAQALAELIEP